MERPSWTSEVQVSLSNLMRHSNVGIEEKERKDWGGVKGETRTPIKVASANPDCINVRVGI